MNRKAPLVIFVYKRSEETRRMLECVERCDALEETDVFIFSDGNKNENDYEAVMQVRKVIEEFRSNTKAKSVTITYAETNQGLANSIISGVTSVIDKYNRVIVLEDDLLVKPEFILFMNDCLDYYKENMKIWSIGGTTYEMLALNEYQDDVWACYRAQSCGWATWKNRWDAVDWSVSDFPLFLKDKNRRKMFLRGGSDMIFELKRQLKGETDSWAIRWCYQQSKQNMLTILPIFSLLDNIGWNGSGVHCGTESRFPLRLRNEKFTYKLKDVDVDEKIMEEFRSFFYRSPINRILDKIYIFIVPEKYRRK